MSLIQSFTSSTRSLLLDEEQRRQRPIADNDSLDLGTTDVHTLTLWVLLGVAGKYIRCEVATDKAAAACPASLLCSMRSLATGLPEATRGPIISGVGDRTVTIHQLNAFLLAVLSADADGGAVAPQIAFNWFDRAAESFLDAATPVDEGNCLILFCHSLAIEQVLVRRFRVSSVAGPEPTGRTSNAALCAVVDSIHASQQAVVRVADKTVRRWLQHAAVLDDRMADAVARVEAMRVRAAADNAALTAQQRAALAGAAASLKKSQALRREAHDLMRSQVALQTLTLVQDMPDHASSQEEKYLRTCLVSSLEALCPCIDETDRAIGLLAGSKTNLAILDLMLLNHWAR